MVGYPVAASPNDAFRIGKAYTVWQAARLAGVTTQTAKHWLLGYEGTYGRVDPVFGDRAAPPSPTEPVLMLSFLELVELVIVGRFRKRAKPIRLERIRAAHKFAREEWKMPYPFASISLREFGGHLLLEFDREYPGYPYEAMALDMQGQPTLPGLVKTEVEQNLIYPDMFAGRWYPRGRSIPIVVDPLVAAGRPAIENTGITVATIRARWNGGESMRSLAEDYGVKLDTIDQVLHVADLAA